MGGAKAEQRLNEPRQRGPSHRRTPPVWTSHGRRSCRRVRWSAHLWKGPKWLTNGRISAARRPYQGKALTRGSYAGEHINLSSSLTTLYSKMENVSGRGRLLGIVGKTAAGIAETGIEMKFCTAAGTADTCATSVVLSCTGRAANLEMVMIEPS